MKGDGHRGWFTDDQLCLVKILHLSYPESPLSQDGQGGDNSLSVDEASKIERTRKLVARVE